MIAISAGHYPDAKGAKHGDFYEYPETMEWARKIYDRLCAAGVNPLLVPAEDLTTKIKFINTFVKSGRVQLAVEIHFNSSPGGGGKGSETLFCPGSVKGMQAASVVQSALGSIMTPNRGIKEGWYKMDRPGIQDYPGDRDGDETPDAFLMKTKCTALVIEPEFIQRKSVIESMQPVACDVIADSLYEIVSVLGA